VVAHHRYKIEIACPGCGAEGAIHVVEDAGPPFTDMPRRAYTADNEGRFALTTAEGAPRIECLACRAVFAAPI